MNDKIRNVNSKSTCREHLRKLAGRGTYLVKRGKQVAKGIGPPCSYNYKRALNEKSAKPDTLHL